MAGAISNGNIITDCMSKGSHKGKASLVRFHLCKGKLYLDEGNEEAALDSFTKALETTPSLEVLDQIKEYISEEKEQYEQNIEKINHYEPILFSGDLTKFFLERQSSEKILYFIRIILDFCVLLIIFMLLFRTLFLPGLVILEKIKQEFPRFSFENSKKRYDLNKLYSVSRIVGIFSHKKKN